MNIEQEAAALEALEKKDGVTPQPWQYESSWGTFYRSEELGRYYDIGGEDDDANGKFIVALRNRAMPLIRALMKQVNQRNITLREAETNLEVSERARDSLESQLATVQGAAIATRFEALEAERDIWKERAQGWAVPHGGTGYDNPTPAEIAARVEQNRKEKKP